MSDNVDGNVELKDEAAEPEEHQPEPEQPPQAEVPYDLAFRITVFYDTASGRYGARSDELGELDVWGDSRAEALREAEAMVESKLAALAAKGQEVPRPFDLDGVEAYSGQLEVAVSRGLHRELTRLARLEGVSLGHMVGELLAAGAEARATRGRASAAGGAERGRGRRDGEFQGRGRRGLSADRYHDIMEDKAAFMEYVRGLDSGGGRGGRGGRGQRGR